MALWPKRLGKVGVLVGNCFGFVGNRMFGHLPISAKHSFCSRKEQRVSNTSTAALYEFGMAMGPFAVADLAGIDVGWRIRQE